MLVSKARRWYWLRWAWQGPTPDDGDDIDIKVLPGELADGEEPVPSRLRILELDEKQGELGAKSKRKGGKGSRTNEPD